MKPLSVEAARARMVGAVQALTSEIVAIDAASGRLLAQSVTASRDQPPFDASAMDGWAVRRQDVGDRTVDLAIAGESAAGSGHGASLRPGQAVRIFTGAPMPDGADWVVIQEEAERVGQAVRLGPLGHRAPYVRPRGGDFRAGDLLLEPGERLDAWRLSLAAAAGCEAVKVARRPRVAVLCAGDELVRPPRRPGPFQIYESASVALCALIEAEGGVVRRLEPVGDTEAAVVEAVLGLDADLIVTIGGASVGDHDVVKPGLAQLGLELSVASVNVRPGKPTWFGTLGDGRKVLGLPGNPASAMVCAELFLRPLIDALQGAKPPPQPIWARFAEAVGANGAREHFMRATLGSSDDGAVTVRPFAEQDSSLVSVFAKADALLRRAPHAPAAKVGEAVQVIRLERL